ncbi:MAG: hypothetical protein WC683_00890 [bacterium]
MNIESQRSTCFKCGTVFDAEIVINAPLDVAIASLRAVACPSCGAREIGLGGEYPDRPPLSEPVSRRANWWRYRGDTGTSSLTIYAAITGGGGSRFDYPHDPDDYRRCRALLDLLPEWRGQLSWVTDRFPWFAPFEVGWDEFDRLWDEESPSGQCPKLYEALQAARKKADQIEIEKGSRS